MKVQYEFTFYFIKDDQAPLVIAMATDTSTRPTTLATLEYSVANSRDDD
jgi:hypothetical protein